MKKIFITRGFIPLINHLIYIMRVFFLLFFIGVSSALAESYSQQARLSLHLNNVSIAELFSEIEKSSEYIFLYKENVPVSSKVSIDIRDATLEEVLDKTLLPKNIIYSINDRQVIVAREMKNSSGPRAPSQQQENITLTGIVVDSYNEPIIGANVVEKGTTNGSVTDLDGLFSLTLHSGRTIIVSYIGYTPREINVGTETNLRIILSEDMQKLSEVVVVGYGTQRRASITGSVSTVENKDIVKAPVANLSNSLGGKVSGLRVVTRGGEPGWNDSEIDIRGFGSALVIVDGVPSSFSQLDANEIESISVLKDASAAVYGVQAANGVIVVTTKKGETGIPRINFNTTLSWQRPTKFPRLANAAEFAELTDEDKINRGLEPTYGPDELRKWQEGGPGYESTDWYDMIVRPWAPQQQYNVNIRGGKEDLRYFTSIGYLDQQGMWRSGSNNFNRFNFRSNIDANLSHGFSTTVQLSGRKEKRHSPSISAANIMNGLMRNYPTFSPYANNNKDYLAETNVSFRNLFAVTDKEISGYYRGETKVFEGQASLQYDASAFIKGLNAKINYYYNTSITDGKTFNKKYTLYKYDESSNTYNPTYIGNDPSNLKREYKDIQNKIFQGSVSYDNIFLEKHSVTALFLFETRQRSEKWFNAYREFIIDSIDELNAGSDENKTNEGTSLDDANVGYVGRINYAYADKYLMEFSFRYDGSSKFPSNSRWGFFPSVSVGWRISEENFIQNNIDFLDDLKIRASWGRLGDDTGVARFQFLSGYSYPDGNFVFGDKVIPTLVSTGLENPDITWFTSDLYNVGIDFTLWQGLLGGELDVFYRKRDGLLARRTASLPGTFGSTLPYENLNSDSDRGYEIVLRHFNRLTNGIEYSIRGNVSYTRSKYEHIERNPSVNLYRNWRDDTNGRWKNVEWGYKAIGQFQSYEEIASAPVQDDKGNTTLRPGDIRYLDYNGDGVIDDNDMHVIGRGNKPEYMFGLDLGFSWKGVDASVFFQGAANFNTYFEGELQYPFSSGSNTLSAFMDRWRREDLYDPTSNWIPGKYPSTYSNGLDSNKKKSSFWLQNSSYLRVKEIQIGYSLPKTLIRSWGLENLRFFVSGYNLFTISGIDLTDPENSAATGQYYPQQKIISCGLNLTL